MNDANCTFQMSDARQNSKLSPKVKQSSPHDLDEFLEPANLSKNTSAILLARKLQSDLDEMQVKDRGLLMPV
jgi:hypothetical protein